MGAMLPAPGSNDAIIIGTPRRDRSNHTDIKSCYFAKGPCNGNLKCPSYRRAAPPDTSRTDRSLEVAQRRPITVQVGRNLLGNGLDQRAQEASIRVTPLENWTYGLSLVALTLATHAAGVTFMLSALRGIRLRLEGRSLRLSHVFVIVVGAITAIGLLLAALHGIEAAFWAAAYLWLGALGSPKAAILYSIDAMTTRGASGLTLQPSWQMMGALEAANGMLVFGISTAFIFSVLQFYNEHLVFRALSGGSTGPGSDLVSNVRIPLADQSPTGGNRHESVKTGVSV